MLTNKLSCNIIIYDSKRVSRSLKTEHERIKRTTKRNFEKYNEDNEIETETNIKKTKTINFIESLILAQDERWRRA